eukprot:TRINITY_DN6349_c0_g2_i2.p1 TRINITY_DN6349_c0_g2~~TRINITY_DN6349_c0_g2_i2.p1  ORF type:complete len:400 (-),score=70.36 TRINITY_DN6349_c0_g2_i2:49-1224(-)
MAKKLVNKCQLRVYQSVSAYGVIDETGKLQPGQIFLQKTTGNSMEVVLGPVVSMKNPCYCVGDIKILQAVDVKELHHIKDCVVFPQTGEKPVQHEISGGYLDGDRYFVCWDTRFIPSKVYNKSMEYGSYFGNNDISIKPFIHEGFCITEPMLNKFAYWFIKYCELENLGLLTHIHTILVDKKGALDDECERIGLMCNQAADIAKHYDESDHKFSKFLQEAEEVKKKYQFIEPPSWYKPSSTRGYSSKKKALTLKDQIIYPLIQIDEHLKTNTTYKDNLMVEFAENLKRKFNKKLSDILNCLNEKGKKKFELIDRLKYNTLKKMEAKYESEDDRIEVACICYDKANQKDDQKFTFAWVFSKYLIRKKVMALMRSGELRCVRREYFQTLYPCR